MRQCVIRGVDFATGGEESLVADRSDAVVSVRKDERPETAD